MSSREMGYIRNQFNTAAGNHLSNYANTHDSEWRAAAKELDISIDGAMYGDQFRHQPEGMGLDTSAGVPNSRAEQIFRHIASAADVAKFDAKMAPARQKMQERVEQNVLEGIETKTARLMEFAPDLAILEAAGITPDDLSHSLITHNKDGSNSINGLVKNDDLVTSIINNNPDIRSLYDAKWDRLATKHNLNL